MNAHDKLVIETWRLRFLRRAAGRIGKREARELGRRWLDIAVRFASDNLEGREPFAAIFTAEKKRWGAPAARDFARSRRARFFHYGPQVWPGETLVFTGRGWRVQCAPDCACGKCYRPAFPITSAVMDACPFLEGESGEEYHARLSGPRRLARASDRPAPLAATG